MILIKNGTLVSPDGCRRADLLADEGKIVKIATISANMVANSN